MSAFVLKCFALSTMLIDHVGYVLLMLDFGGTVDINLLRAIGRIAFPVYVFLLVNGLEKTSDKWAYLTRLSLFALLSQIPFSLAFTYQNYFPAETAASFSFSLYRSAYLPAALGACLFFLLAAGAQRKRFFFLAPPLFLSFLQLTYRGVTVIGEDLNVFYSLTLYFACLWLLSEWQNFNHTDSKSKLLLFTLALACGILCILPHSDYGFEGLFLALLLYVSRRSRILQALCVLLWLVYMYAYSLRFVLLGALACLLILLYNGRKGRAAKQLFYFFYPAHLLLLFLLAKAYIGA